MKIQLKNKKGEIGIGVILLLAIAGGGYYFFIYESGIHNPFDTNVVYNTNVASSLNDIRNNPSANWATCSSQDSKSQQALDMTQSVNDAIYINGLKIADLACAGKTTRYYQMRNPTPGTKLPILCIAYC